MTAQSGETLRRPALQGEGATLFFRLPPEIRLPEMAPPEAWDAADLPVEFRVSKGRVRGVQTRLSLALYESRINGKTMK